MLAPDNRVGGLTARIIVLNMAVSGSLIELIQVLSYFVATVNTIIVSFLSFSL